MLTNRQTRELLRQNRNDFTKFRKFLCLTHQGLEYRLKDESLKNNLSGAYKEFLINEKKGKSE